MVITGMYSCTNDSDTETLTNSIPLTLNTNNFDIQQQGGNINLEITSNGNFLVKIGENCENWIHKTKLSNTSGTYTSTNGIYVSSLKFTVDPNTDYDTREGSIEISSGENKATVIVNQAGGGILNMTKKEFNLSSAEQELDIAVNSNFDYAIDLSGVDWIMENTATRAVKASTIKLKVKENTSYDSRSVTLRIYDRNGSTSDNVTITQSQLNALQLEQRVFSFDENGGTFNVNVNSNVEYMRTINCGWINENNTRGLSATTHAFTVAKLTDNIESREGRVTFTDYQSGLTDYVVVKQTKALFMETTSITMEEGENKQVSIKNNTQQTVKWESSDNNIVTIDANGIAKAISRGTATVKAYTADNKHEETCTIAVKDITDMVTTYFSGGVLLSDANGKILPDSKIYWYIKNNSNSNITLQSIQLIENATGTVKTTLTLNAVISSGQSDTYTTEINGQGINTPLTCRYNIVSNGKTYFKDIIYHQGDNPGWKTE